MVIDGDNPVTVTALHALTDRDGRLRVVQAPSEERVPGHREGWARNVGLQAATSTVVLALDDDLTPAEGLVGGHASWHESAPDLVVLGYMPVAAGRAPAGAVTRLFSQGYEQACLEFERNPDGVLLGLWGGNFSVRRDRWLAALGQTSFGGVFHEDRELGLLFHQAGLRGVFDRGLRADHRHDGTIEQCIGNARLSALAQVRLHRLFPDLVEDPRRPDVAGSARRVFQALGAITARPAAWRCATAVVSNVAAVSARFRLAPGEWLAIRALRRLAFERGLREASADPESPDRPSAPVPRWSPESPRRQNPAHGG